MKILRLPLVLLLNAACLPALAANSTQTVNVLLKNDAIELDVNTIKPGKVIFDVTNSPDNKTEHEMVVLRSDLDDNKLPVKGARVEEGKLKNLGEAHDMKPGKSKRLALTLPAGHYDLICNIPGHYAMGMHSSLTVAP